MKILLSISIICGLALIAFILFGISLDENVVVEESIVVDAPSAVVWTALTSFDQHHKWQKSIEVLYNYNNSARQVRYNFGDRTLLVNQQVRIRESALSIDFIQIGKEEYTTLQKFGGQIVLNPLSDGNTEIKWSITYTTPSISEKVINRYKNEKLFRALLKTNLESFKNFIES